MMANNTLARPYAKAAFEYALQANELAQWSNMLHYAAFIVQNEHIKPLLMHPKVTQAQLAEFILAMGGSVFNQQAQNFIHFVATQRRVSALPGIFNLYEQYRAEQEQVVTAEVTSAFPLDAQTQAKMTDALAKRLQCKIKLQCEVDNHLLGGAIIKVADFVIDGSVRSKLATMASTLAN